MNDLDYKDERLADDFIPPEIRALIDRVKSKKLREDLEYELDDTPETVNETGEELFSSEDVFTAKTTIERIEDIVDWNIPLQTKIEYMESQFTQIQYSCARHLILVSHINSTGNTLDLLVAFTSARIPLDIRLDCAKALVSKHGDAITILLSFRREAVDLNPHARIDYLLDMYQHDESIMTELEEFMYETDTSPMYKHVLASRFSDRYDQEGALLVLFMTICTDRMVSMVACRKLLAFQQDVALEYLEKTLHDETLSQRDRADAADIILSSEPNRLVPHAKLYLQKVSNINFFLNSENAHDGDLRERSSRILKDIIEYIDSNHITVPSSEEVFPKTFDDNDPVNRALYRIEFDETLIGGSDYRLADAYRYIVALVNSSTNAPDLRKRMRDELKDMSDTCNTGYFTRLIMSIQCGLDEGILPSTTSILSIQSEIKSRLHHALGKLLNMDAEAVSELIESDINKKPKTLYIIREGFGSIVNTIEKEYEGSGHDPQVIWDCIHSAFKDYKLI